MIMLDQTGAKILTKEEFCEKAKISENHWLFEEMGPNPRFWMFDYHDADYPERYYFDNDIYCIREFKHMPKDKETWTRAFDYAKTPEGKKGEWGLWYTWKAW